jgi:hypothetical protein
MNINRPQRLIRPIVRPLILTLALAGIPAVALASASTSTAATCATTTARWGSLAKTFRPMSEGPITGVRAGRQTCFDRMVVDLRSRSAGYRVRYVSQVFTEGEGAVIPLRGGARLEIITARADDVNTGVPAYNPRNRRELANVTGFSTFRQIAWGGSFEGQSTIGLGVRSRLPMRAFIVNGPGAGSRVVIDVAHRW